MRNPLGRAILIVCAVPLTCLLLMFGVGLVLQAKIEATQSIVINRPPENVWYVLTDYARATLWHPQYRESRQISELGETPIRYRVTYSDGAVADITVTAETYAKHLAERISDNDLPFSGDWSVEIERDGDQSRVTAHSTVELHRPLDRLLVRLLVHPNAELSKILEALKQRVESATAKPSA